MPSNNSPTSAGRIVRTARRAPAPSPSSPPPPYSATPPRQRHPASTASQPALATLLRHTQRAIAARRVQPGTLVMLRVNGALRVGIVLERRAADAAAGEARVRIVLLGKAPEGEQEAARWVALGRARASMGMAERLRGAEALLDEVLTVPVGGLVFARDGGYVAGVLDARGLAVLRRAYVRYRVALVRGREAGHA